MTFNRDGSEYFIAAKRMNSIWRRELHNIFSIDPSKSISDSEKCMKGNKSDSKNLSPPNLASPRILDDSGLTSGMASWSNVVRFAEDHNRLRLEEIDENNIGSPSAGLLCSKGAVSPVKKVKLIGNIKQKRKRTSTPRHLGFKISPKSDRLKSRSR